jgi:hypothetical protein
MTRTYETCGKEFTSRKAANRFARNIANASSLRVPVYETDGSDWEQRVTAYEEEGLTRSDAQAVVDAEDQA